MSVDLDSFRVQKTHESLHLSLEEWDSEIEGIGSDVAPRTEPEQDFLSNIIDTLNDAHQTDFTPVNSVNPLSRSSQSEGNKKAEPISTAEGGFGPAH